MKSDITRLVASAFLIANFFATCSARAAELQVDGLHAWYRSDGLKTSGATIVGWENSAMGATPEAAARRHLNRVVGQPRAFRVTTADGERTVLRLDGNSALWQAAGDWGSLDGGRTLVVIARLTKDTEGFLFDGSTNSRLTRAQVRAGQWQVGVQSPPISNASNVDAATIKVEFGAWQVHGFVFEKQSSMTRATHFSGDSKEWRSLDVESKETAPLGGLIVGANATTKLGIKADVAELLVFDRALSLAEQKQIANDLRTRWGQPTDLPADKQPQPLGITKQIKDPQWRLCFQGPGAGIQTTDGTLIFPAQFRDASGSAHSCFIFSRDHGDSWTISPMRPNCPPPPLNCL